MAVRSERLRDERRSVGAGIACVIRRNTINLSPSEEQGLTGSGFVASRVESDLHIFPQSTNPQAGSAGGSVSCVAFS